MKQKKMPLLLLVVLSIIVSMFLSDNNVMVASTAEEAQASQVSANTVSDLETKTLEIKRLLSEAKAQVEAKDYTCLSQPVKYRILWLGYTRVTYKDLDFRMTSFDKEYLEAVTLNFEKVVENYSGNNIDIEVDLYFVNTPKELTKTNGDDWLYLAQETVQSDINAYTAKRNYDTVLTTVQTKGKENTERNNGKALFGKHDVILGLKTAGIADEMGYSTFNLYTPKEGTYPLKNVKIPSLYATAVAIHEWMHQLEYLGTMLGIEYPSTHAYMGEPEYPGYEKYENDPQYDYCAFYKKVLEGKLPYTGNGSVQYVGMYPKMWKLVKRGVFNIGEYTFKSSLGEYYLTGQNSDPTLTIASKPNKWIVRYCVNGKYILIPKNIPEKRMDLSNAVDKNGNPVGIWTYTSYVDAQSWRLTKNSDNTFCIRTAYSSGRVLTINKPGSKAVIRDNAFEASQKWIIVELGLPTVTPTKKPTATPTKKPTVTPTKAPTMTPIPKTTTTIYYKGYDTPYIHYKIGNGQWTSVPGVQMQKCDELTGYTHKITVDLGTATMLTVCFNNGNGSWDSRNGANYTFNVGTYTYSNGVIKNIAVVSPTVKPIVTVTPTCTPTVTPISKNTATIYYKGYNTPYIHYKVGDGNWTSAPGVKMQTSNEILGYTHKVIIDLQTSNTLTACFNDGNGNWDSRNGANYIFNAGKYTYSNGTITNLSKVIPTVTPAVTKKPTSTPTVTPIQKNTTSIYYKGYDTPYIHYKIGNGSWTNVPGVRMEATTEMSGYTHKITINLGTSTDLTACFHDGNGNWDSRNGANYNFKTGTYKYSNGSITKVQ